MKQLTITIDGMHCGGCVSAVKRVLDRTPGVVESRVEVGRADVNVDESQVTDAALREAIEGAGFEARAIAPATP